MLDEAVSTGPQELETTGGTGFFTSPEVRATRPWAVYKHVDKGFWRSDRFSVMILHFGPLAIALVSVYLKTGVGFSAANARALSRLREVLELLNLPFLLIGDWNMAPGMLEDSGWLHEMSACYMTPWNVEYTCNIGQPTASLLGYLVASVSLRPLLRELVADTEVPWGPHVGLQLTFQVKVKAVIVTSFRKIGAWPFGPDGG